MSETETQIHSSTPPSQPRSPLSSTQGFIRDVVLWRRRNLSLMTLLVSTITWVLLEAYQLNFVTVASWACMLAISSLFLWDNFIRLLGKEPGRWSSWKVSQESVEVLADSVREVMEGGIRWMFRVSAEKEWYTFVWIVVLLFIASKVAAFFDLLSLLYTGTLVGLTLPVMYLKYEDWIKRYAEGLKARWKKICEMLDDRVVRKVKSRFDVHFKKIDNKVE